MNVSYKWINELVDSGLSAEEMAKSLTAAGCAIEEMHKLPNGDTQLVAEITSNRPDWLCHYGVAREVAAITGKQTEFPEISITEKGDDINKSAKITVHDPDLCPRYTARLIRGVTIKESPAWLKEKIEAVGLRPINNVVDVTNYILYEMNQPLHSFDFDLLKGGEINVRRGIKGEELLALDGTKCKLDSSMLVIADGKDPMAIAGVMGGAESEVTEKTVNILLESAYFEPTQVRRTSRKLKLISDSSYRFERGIDLGAVERASARACQLIIEVAGGELDAGIIDSAPGAGEECEVEMRYSRCNKVLGCEFAREDIKKVFIGLGLEVLSDNAESIKVSVPTFRGDLTREIDLIEEVARLIGYDKIPDKITMLLQRSHESVMVSGERIARQALANIGYHECVTDPFVPQKWQEEGKAPKIVNPVDSGRPVMRMSIIPSLLEVNKVNRSVAELQLFEINRVYTENTRSECYSLCMLDKRGVEYLHGALIEVFKALRVENFSGLTIKIEDNVKCNSGEAIAIYLDGVKLGFAGMITPELVKRHDLNGSTAVLEVDFERIVSLPRSDRVYHDLPRFPGIRRDIALVVPEKVAWLEIERIIAKHGMPEELKFESVYRGKGLAAGEKSVAFSFMYRNAERSLTDAEANDECNKLVAHLTAEIGGSKLR